MSITNSKSGSVHDGDGMDIGKCILLNKTTFSLHILFSLSFSSLTLLRSVIPSLLLSFSVAFFALKLIMTAGVVLLQQPTKKNHCSLFAQKSNSMPSIPEPRSQKQHVQQRQLS